MAIYSLLDQLAIPYQRVDHPPVFTCEEASKLLPDLPAAKTKNLFLRDPKSERLFLVVSPEDHRVDLKALAVMLGVKRLSFGSPERLDAVLGLTPGSVTLLAMVRDREKAVELVVDEAIWQAEPGAVPSAGQHRYSDHPPRRRAPSADPSGQGGHRNALACCNLRLAQRLAVGFTLPPTQPPFTQRN